MPTYDYQCGACGHTFEQFQSITASPIKKCPGCGKLKLRRLLGTGAGLIFKGAGFYETDYRSEGYKKAAQNDKPASDVKAADKADKTKTETPVAAKSETKTEAAVPKIDKTKKSASSGR